MKRRDFIKDVVQTAALTSVSAFSAKNIPGANDRVKVGLIGCGGRGRLVAGMMRESPNVTIGAVCDVYDTNLLAAREWASGDCQSYKDFRELLARKDIDAVIVATPDHWHAIPAVLACQAGKDVYIEKPLAHNIKEGRAIVEAARRNNRVVQVGTQHRSSQHYREIARIIQSGELGRVHFVRIWNYVNTYPDGLGLFPDSDPPAGVDWDFYLGPAPYHAYNRGRFIASYRFFYDYAGGMITDFGTHRFDSLHQVMDVDAPLSVSACGERYALKDGADTPDVIQATYEYPGFTLSYEAMMLNGHGCGGRTPGKAYYNARGKEDRPHGEAFYGTNGTLFSDRIGFEIVPELNGSSMRLTPGPSPPSEGYRMERKEAAGQDATSLHVRDFIECVRTRKKPVADVEIGHRSSIVGHLGNIAYRTKRRIRWDAIKEEIIGDSEASMHLTRQARKPWDIL
jgi:predicted dehydrogenase